MKNTWLAALAALVLATAAFAAKPKSTNSTGILGLALDAAFAKKSKLKIPSYLEVRQEGRDVVVFANREETLPEDLVIPEGVTAIGGYAFNGCTSLANVTVPSSVTSIGDYAFLGCTSLTSVTIPEGVKYIGKMAFEGCSLLADVTIPESVMYILDGAFDGCMSLKEIQFGGTMAQWQEIIGSDMIKVPYMRFSDGNIGVEEVPEYLEIRGTEVTGYTGKVPANLVIPEGITKIWRGAFSG